MLAAQFWVLFCFFMFQFMPRALWSQAPHSLTREGSGNPNTIPFLLNQADASDGMETTSREQEERAMVPVIALWGHSA